MMGDEERRLIKRCEVLRFAAAGEPLLKAIAAQRGVRCLGMFKSFEEVEMFREGGEKGDGV